MRNFVRSQTRMLMGRLAEPPRLIQIVAGPRQVGKTTALAQAVRAFRGRGFASVSVSADALAAPPRDWISEQWARANRIAKSGRPVILAFDELQKIPGWSETVKLEFDRNQRRRRGARPRVVLTGSSALMVEKGLTESLAGRFELIRFPHWNLDEEMRAFRRRPDDFLGLGGYPRLAEFKSDFPRFLQYVRDAVIEPVLSRDILLLHPVDKPALLRRLFEFACHHPAEIVSLQKMLGQLTDRGNVTVISHYLDLLAKAFLVTPLQKFSREILRVRPSSPKLIVMAQALIAAVQNKTPAELAVDRERLGRWAENAVGAHLIRSGLDVFYWRDRDREIDFIAGKGSDLMAIEVTSGERGHSAAAVERLAGNLGIHRFLLVGPGGVDIPRFLRTPPDRWLKKPGGTLGG